MIHKLLNAAMVGAVAVFGMALLMGVIMAWVAFVKWWLLSLGYNDPAIYLSVAVGVFLFFMTFAFALFQQMEL